MSAAASFFYDYIDPASFLIERQLAALEAEAAVAVKRLPFELRPPPSPLIDPLEEAWRERWRDAQGATAAAGIEFASPRLVPWTRKAHELALEAGGRDRFEPVHRALFEAYQLQGRDLGRVDVLLDIAVRNGMDLTRTKAVLDVDRHTAALEQARAQGERLGVAGVPALLSGGRRLVGFHDRGTLLAFLRAR